jgi:hypothetical protein
MKMRVKLQNHIFHSGVMAKKEKKDLSNLIDRSMGPIGTCSIVAGLGAAATGRTSASAYLLATGVLLHLVSWFGDWWKK